MIKISLLVVHVLFTTMPMCTCTFYRGGTISWSLLSNGTVTYSVCLFICFVSFLFLSNVVKPRFVSVRLSVCCSVVIQLMITSRFLFCILFTHPFFRSFVYCSFIYSLFRSFVYCSFIYSLFRSFVYIINSLIRSFVRLYIVRSFIRSFARLYIINSFIRSFAGSYIFRLFIRSFAHSYIIDSLIHSSLKSQYVNSTVMQ